MVFFRNDPALSSISTERRKELQLFEQKIKARFRNINLLNLAFSHKSYSFEMDGISGSNNEKLEFLGDSILGMVISEYLYENLADQNEGGLAKIKSFVVSENTLSKIAKKIGIDRYLLISRGEEYSGGREKKAILADCMEAIIGALYLDAGFKVVKRVILDFFIPEIKAVLENRHQKDYKTLLQEFVQKKYKTYPRYTIVKKKGPDHDRTYWIEVNIGGRSYGRGKGKNKKEAEQKAAGMAFRYLNKPTEAEEQD